MSGIGLPKETVLALAVCFFLSLKVKERHKLKYWERRRKTNSFIAESEVAMSKKQELMNFLSLHVFNPVLDSPSASKELKSGINLTIARMNQRDAMGMVQYFWSAVIGTERSIGFAHRMRQEGFTRFEEVLEEFRVRFDDDWLRS